MPVVTFKERILDKLKKASEPLTPKQIHVRTRIKHNTVKVYVRKLLTEGLISQPYSGAYGYKTHPRCGEAPPHVQNLILSVAANIAMDVATMMLASATSLSSCVVCLPRCSVQFWKVRTHHPMTQDEYARYRKRLYAIYEKGFEIKVHA